jgi:hypothetical protein
MIVIKDIIGVTEIRTPNFTFFHIEMINIRDVLATMLFDRKKNLMLKLRIYFFQLGIYIHF